MGFRYYEYFKPSNLHSILHAWITIYFSFVYVWYVLYLFYRSRLSRLCFGGLIMTKSVCINHHLRNRTESATALLCHNKISLKQNNVEIHMNKPYYLKRDSRQLRQKRCPQEVCHGSLNAFLHTGHVSRSSNRSRNFTLVVHISKDFKTVPNYSQITQDSLSSAICVLPLGRS